MFNKTSLVFVPGGWHRAETFDKLISLLKADYPCEAINLPTIKSGDISTSLADDVRTVQECVASKIQQGNHVVLVTHSYGALVGQSAVKGFNTGSDEVLLDVHERPIIGIVIIASGFAESNMTLIEALGGEPFPFMTLDDDGFSRVCMPARELFYHDLEEEEAEKWVGKLQPQSNRFATAGGEAMYSGWKDAPCWHITTTDDKAFPLEAQRMAVQMARDAGGNVTVRDIQTSHSPMLSRPEDTACIVKDAITAFLK